MYSQGHIKKNDVIVTYIHFIYLYYPEDSTVLGKDSVRRFLIVQGHIFSYMIKIRISKTACYPIQSYSNAFEWDYFKFRQI